MRTLKAATALALMFVFAGCWVLSIDPLYTQDDLSFNPALAGIWGDPGENSEETWTFLPHGETAYRLVIKEEGASDAVFEAHLLTLDNRLYLDLLPEVPESISEAQLGHLIPAHSFWTVTLENDVLTLDILDAEWLQTMVDSAKVDIGHIRRDNAIVLTARTKDLQAFVIEHVGEAFTGDPVTMHRLH